MLAPRLIITITLLGRSLAFTSLLLVPSVQLGRRGVVLGADADPTFDDLCSTLAPEPRFRWQRENLECGIIPGGLRDTSLPRGGLLLACEEARNGRDVEKREGVKVGHQPS